MACVYDAADACEAVQVKELPDTINVPEAVEPLTVPENVYPELGPAVNDIEIVLPVRLQVPEP